MIQERMEQALIRHLNAEIYSAYLYGAMSSYFLSVNLPGFANWMRVQVQEEMLHATKFYDFIHARGGRVILKAIEEPPAQWASSLDAFEAALAHERKVTGLINTLVDLAVEAKDHATQIFLQWFVTEQVEEEDNAQQIIQKINLMGDAKGSLYMLDRELAQRVFTPPAQGQA